MTKIAGGRTSLSVRLAMLLALSTSAASPSAGQESAGDEGRRTFSIQDPRSAMALVATVGSLEITARQFLLSYEFGPGFTKRTDDPKERYLQFMIYEKLLALDAYSRGAEKTPEVVDVLAEIEGDLATEELYKDEILNTLRVTEGEIEEGVAKERSRVSIEWLYAPGVAEARHLREQLSTGIPFDSLLSLQLGDSVAKDDRSMETTRLRLIDRNPVLASLLDTLRRGRISAPLQGPDGWYIVRLANEWTDLLSTESADIKAHEDVRRAILKRRADSLSDAYVHRMMLDHEPVIQREAFTILGSYLGHRVLPPETSASWVVGERVDSSGIARSQHLPLVILTDRTYDIRDFLKWYRAREFNLKLNTRSRDAFERSCEQLVWRMVRDRLLMARALSRNLQGRTPVTEQKKWWEEKILYEMEKSAIARTIRLDEQALRQYYDEHKRDYRDSNGQDRPFERVREEVQRDLYTYDMTRKTLRKILALKEKHPVEIHKQTLRSLPTGPEDLPRAIEVYAVKKGGTFPHQAFPTIDTQWRTWN